MSRRESGGAASPDSRRVIVSGNWKMHHNHFEALRYIQELASLLRATPLNKDRELAIFPPFTSLRTVQTAIDSDAVPAALGAQSCHDQDHGAFTGEVSAPMLAKLGVTYVLCGHSERRAMCGETDDVVRAKLAAIVRNGLVPTLCVGETAEERESGQAHSRVRQELEAALGGQPAAVVATMVIAYEPIWAIGSGATASPGDAEEMCAAIRAVVGEIYGEKSPAPRGVRVQYGGSVTPDNAGELLRCANIDGLLVGGASLDAKSFVGIATAG